MKRAIQSSLIVMVLLCAVPLKAESYVEVDSLTGRIEVRKAGSEKWTVSGKGTRLYNNDLVRVAKNSSARLRWSNGSMLFLHPNTQILINCYEDLERKTLSRHVTVFWGALFFLVKKALPQDFTGSDTKVYTPTTVVATRGTSFEVNIRDKNGTTEVKVVHGTLLVRNILRNVSTFLKAGYKTMVSVGTDPILPEAIVAADFDALRKWVLPQVIENEKKRETVAARRNRDVITGKLEERVLVVPFLNNTQYQGTWDLEKEFPRLIAKKLKTGMRNLSITILDSLVPGARDPLQLGIQHDARWVIAGNIESFDISRHVKVSAAADEYKEYTQSTVRLYLQVIDVKKNQMIYENYFSGSSRGTCTPKNTWKELEKLPFNLKNQHFLYSILGDAINQVTIAGTEELFRYVHTH